MKTTLLTLGLLFILKIGYSQNPNYDKNEISIGLISLTESPKNEENLFENDYYFIPFSNLTYKRFLNEKNAIRISFYRPITKSNEKPPSNWNDNSEYKEQVFKIGYEYILKQKGITPYMAIDITYLKSTSSRIVGGGFTGETHESENNKNGIGLTPTIGINYKIHKNIFIGLESNLSIMNMKNEKISTQLFPETNELPTKENSTSFEYIFNPIQFIVKIKF